MRYQNLMKNIETDLDLTSLSHTVLNEIEKLRGMVEKFLRGEGGFDNEPNKYFSNFILRLPYVSDLRLASDLSKEELLERWGEDYLSRLNNILDSVNKEQIGQSKVRKEQTLRQFYIAIDETLKEANSYNNIVKLVKDRQSKDMDINKRIESKSAIFQMAAPAFFMLLEKGYNYYPDLTG